MNGELRIPASATTTNGFRNWFASPQFPERIRASLIRGELLIESSLEDLLTHNQVKSEISAVLSQLVDQLDRGIFCHDGMLLTNPEADVSTVPDAVFARYESIEAGRVRISTIGAGSALVEWQGSPDWVLEVVSASSVKKDTEDLLNGYWRAGIPEYWLVDARGKTIDFRILQRTDSGYSPIVPENDWLASPVFGCRFRLSREMNRVNMWRYNLDVEPATV
jgi:Uma2 family endonuclease